MKNCECGEWSGEMCAWTGPEAELLTVEFMPDFLRESHSACNNRGLYPHNGAVRVRVERSCADRMVQHDDWCEQVSL